ncbi:MAG: rhodanese-like domain-containing protein [Gammaproteobacteria bacterium]
MHKRCQLVTLLRYSRYRRLAWLFVLIQFVAMPLPVFARALARSHSLRIPPVIELGGLKALLARHTPDVLLVDVRKHADYLRGHLPGAINLPAALTDNQDARQPGIAALAQIRRIMSRAGIRHSDYLVLYDNGMLMQAAHVFWVLETYGHKKISVLDSGYPGWVADQGSISKQVTRLPASHYIPNITTHRLSTELSTLLAARGHDIAIIDARSRNEFLGRVSRARRKGHIINAINIPWSENLVHLAPVPKMKSISALRRLYHMLQPGEHVIAYCNSSMESAVTYLALRRLGYPVSVFDGAWLKWGNDNHLPIAIGPAVATELAHAH